MATFAMCTVACKVAVPSRESSQCSLHSSHQLPLMTLSEVLHQYGGGTHIIPCEISFHRNPASL